MFVILHSSSKRNEINNISFDDKSKSKTFLMQTYLLYVVKHTYLMHVCDLSRCALMLNRSDQLIA